MVLTERQHLEIQVSMKLRDMKKKYYYATHRDGKFNEALYIAMELPLEEQVSYMEKFMKESGVE